MNRIIVASRKVDFDYCSKHFHMLMDSVYLQRREAILRLKNKKAACISLFTGLFLQDIIERQCGIEPDDIVIDTNSKGKPCVEGYPEFNYNISHSGDMVVIAYGNCPVGIDVEELKSADLRVAKRCFCKEEYEYVMGGMEDTILSEDKALRFLQVWTKKEAYLKYKGTGISVPLDSFCVDMTNDTVEGTDIVFWEKDYKGFICNICAPKGTEIIYEN